MEIILFAEHLTKYFFLCLYTFFILKKILNIKDIKKNTYILCIFTSILLGLLYAILKNYIITMFIVLAIILTISIIVNNTTKMIIGHSLFMTTVSYGINLLFFFISLVISGTFVKPLKIPWNNPAIHYIFLYVNFLIEYFLISIFFKIKRFKNGFAFAKDIDRANNISLIGLFLCVTTVITFSSAGNIDSNLLAFIITSGLSTILFSLYLWIRRNILSNYKDKMKDNTIASLKQQLEDEQTRNNTLSKEIQNLSIIHHKYNSKLSATENILAKLANDITNSYSTEISNEISEITNIFKNWSKEYNKEVSEVVSNKKTLSKTNILSIDLLIEHLQIEAIKNNIDFDLKVNCSVNSIIENHIDKNDLEAILGDHIKDAIIAVNNSENSNKCICVSFDICDNFYELGIYDSGISFDIDTLTKIGLEPVTTHKNTGGTGLGFYNTFKILDKCNASLHITEINYKNSNFSKCVAFRFDFKKQFVIYSSRSNKIAQSDINNRIIAQNS